MSSISKLQKISDEQQKALESEIGKFSKKGKEIAVNALFIVGGMALSYLLFKAIAGDQPSKKKLKAGNEVDEKQNDQTPSFFSDIVQTLGREVALVLLDLAREKLTEYLTKEKDK